MRAIYSVAAALCLALGGAPEARCETPAAQDAPPQGPKCIDAQGIREAKILDDWTVLFSMRGKGPDYVMRLQWRCPQLKFHDSFRYELRGDMRLCARTDWIMSRSGSACPIGRFEPVAKKTDPASLRHDPKSEEKRP